ncbi:MAG: 6-phosphogluconolactonase [Gammaproteobacteria bacterium 28-57-27]|nr:MAG: 6-phosphogluconolactonase [Gammaproteobacteria bacterium 28-57-27]
MPQLHIHPDIPALTAAVAQRWLRLAEQAIAQRGRFSVALSGGRTPRALYALLASPAWRERMPWAQTELYLGDERCVSADHADSNARMVRESLLDQLAQPPLFFPMVKHPEHPAQDAAHYAQLLRERLTEDEAYAPPCFDLVLLGMGADGHFASLFPGTLAVEDRETLVLPVWVDALNAWRISLGRRVIAAARARMVLVTGEDKRATLLEVMHNPLSSKPIARLQHQAELEWHIDQAASSHSPRQPD